METAEGSRAGGFPLGGEKTKPYRDKVTSISWPEMAEVGLDHMVSNYRPSSLGCSEPS